MNEPAEPLDSAVYLFAFDVAGDSATIQFTLHGTLNDRFEDDFTLIITQLTGLRMTELYYQTAIYSPGAFLFKLMPAYVQLAQQNLVCRRLLLLNTMAIIETVLPRPVEFFPVSATNTWPDVI